jgi:hypothetical protein
MRFPFLLPEDGFASPSFIAHFAKTISLAEARIEAGNAGDWPSVSWDA